jgi:hypothetical protein
MSDPDQNKPSGKPGRRNRNPDRARNQKPDQRQSRPPEQPQDGKTPEPLQSQEPAQQQQDTRQQVDAAVAPADNLAIDFQTIATAYGDYTRKSLEETRAFVQKLSGVRSLDKAIEVQTEFARQAYETFVMESQKIRKLYRGLAKQSFKPLEGPAKTTER